MTAFENQCKTLKPTLETTENERNMIASKLALSEQQIEKLKIDITKLNEENRSNMKDCYKIFISKLLLFGKWIF